MRRLILAIALISGAPGTAATAEDAAISEPAPAELPAVLPEEITPDVLNSIAEKLERLSRIHLVRIPGGRKTADQRFDLSTDTLALSHRLAEAASALALAQAGQAEYAALLEEAESEAMAATLHVASNVTDLDIRQELFDLLDGPQPDAPEPITHVFCMEASGAGPRTFARYAPESLVQAIPYVQGYITHELTQPANFKLRLSLTVEHDASSAPFAAIDALQAANKDAVAEMDDPDRRAAATILMGEFAEKLCSPT